MSKRLLQSGFEETAQTSKHPLAEPPELVAWVPRRERSPVAWLSAEAAQSATFNFIALVRVGSRAGEKRLKE